ncbi:GNAT family N-acetyltransferase [Nakamurella sp. YIM 132087]|uniref:GNAT family N-acetyltransferase n=2 Tax=Nakamurella alba TaxID=2665158 RepID=A0A7K1FHV3_9ACTN|nr:GNAT family N-acetyltransferase [Nakamurella alba]
MDRTALGGQFWGVAGGRDGLVFDGANLMPLTGDAASMRVLADATGRRGRRCASILGPSDLVLPLWQSLEPRWGAAREVRARQPLLACTAPPAVDPDPFVRQAVLTDLEAYYPAAVAMFTEEVGVDPRWPDGGAAYRSRLAGLIGAGRSFARFEDGRVVFKAEIGAISHRAALIQGVWVAPDRRGSGLAAPGVAALVRHIRTLGRVPTLYVNDFNTAARATYRRIGFEQVGTFASVLF